MNILFLIVFCLLSFLLLFEIITNFKMKNFSESLLNESFWAWGGKINRLYYFLNTLLFLVFIIIFAGIGGYFFIKSHSTKIFFLISPQILYLFCLAFNNIYKRVYAIKNDSKFAKNFIIFWFFGCSISAIPLFNIIIAIIAISLFLMPSFCINWYNLSFNELLECKQQYKKDIFFEKNIFDFILKELQLNKDNKNYIFFKTTKDIKEWIWNKINNVSKTLLESSQYKNNQNKLSEEEQKLLKYYIDSFKVLNEIDKTTYTEDRIQNEIKIITDLKKYL